jgi:hypothetical protein
MEACDMPPAGKPADVGPCVRESAGKQAVIIGRVKPANARPTDPGGQ